MAYAENQVTIEIVNDGFSPIVEVDQSDNAATITVTDVTGTKTDVVRKRQVFVTEPTTPYSVGDLWVTAGGDQEIVDSLITDEGDFIIDSAEQFFEVLTKGVAVYVCMTSRPSGAFVESDWSLAATDNTSVNELREWFWHDANGAHVLGDATGFRNDITSTGMKIVDTDTETDVAEFTTDRVMLASGDALLKYVEDGAAFGLEDSHRVVLSKNADDVGYRNDATLSSRSVPPFSSNSPMGFVNATHKKSGAVKYGQAAMYVWGGGGQIAPYYVILTQGDIGSEDLGKSDALDIYVKELVVNTDDFSINGGYIASNQISDLEAAAAIARDAESTLLNLLSNHAVVEEWGTSGDWRWRVWGDGFVEAWFSGSVTSATGATVVTAPIYRGTWSLSIPSQIGFASAPNILITNNYEPTNVISINGKATSATAISGNFFRVDNQQSTVTLYTRIYAWGVTS